MPKRLKAERLFEKLRAIRLALGLSQSELLEQIGMVGKIAQHHISCYEHGAEPPLRVLLEYARLAGVCVDVLIDDDMELPERLPGKARHRL